MLEFAKQATYYSVILSCLEIFAHRHGIFGPTRLAEAAYFKDMMKMILEKIRSDIN